MAARITTVELKAILDDTELSTTSLTSYINTANVLVNSVLGTGTTDLLKEIEKYLAAHLAVFTRERQAIKEEAGTAKVTYSDNFGEGLKATAYGHMVLFLDTTGKLANLDGKKTASIYAIKSFN